MLYAVPVFGSKHCVQDKIMSCHVITRVDYVQHRGLLTRVPV